jgi:electron transfer flavoprotein alpha subunit
MSILVFVQQDKGLLNPASLSAVTAATQLASFTDTDIHLLLVGHHCEQAMVAAQQLEKVTRVLVVDDEEYTHPLAEQLCTQLVALLTAEPAQYSHLMAASTSLGKDTLPRVAALMGVAQISDILAVEAANRYQRPIYAGNAIATIEALDDFQVVTVRSSAFDACQISDNCAEAETIAAVAHTGQSQFIAEEMATSGRPELGSAARVVSAGRGIGSADNLPVVEALADKLGAALGASRAAVDAGFVSNDLQVGQTGKIVAPDLYIAVGISGAIQHLAGMKDSKVIVAINKDEEAPIFQIADYGLAADLFDAVPELADKLPS